MGIRLATEFTEIKHYCESVGFVFIKHDRIPEKTPHFLKTLSVDDGFHDSTPTRLPRTFMVVDRRCISIGNCHAIIV
jgi:hypothetical protein